MILLRCFDKRCCISFFVVVTNHTIICCTFIQTVHHTKNNIPLRERQLSHFTFQYNTCWISWFSKLKDKTITVSSIEMNENREFSTRQVSCSQITKFVSVKTYIFSTGNSTAYVHATHRKQQPVIFWVNMTTLEC